MRNVLLCGRSTHCIALGSIAPYPTGKPLLQRQLHRNLAAPPQLGSAAQTERNALRVARVGWMCCRRISASKFCVCSSRSSCAHATIIAVERHRAGRHGVKPRLS